MTYYLGKVGQAGARLVSSCKDLYNDVNAAYLTGATDVIVVLQRDGTLKATPFHVRFGKLGVLRTGDLKEVEIEVNGNPVDMTVNIDETGKVFFSHNRTQEVKSHVVINMNDELGKEVDDSPLTYQSSDSFINRSMSAKESGIEPVKSVPNMNAEESGIESVKSVPNVGSLIHLSEEEEDGPIIIRPTDRSTDMEEALSSDEMISCSLPDRLEVLSDSALETDKDREAREDMKRIPLSTALSDTEVEIKDHRLVKFRDSSRTGQSSKGEANSQDALTSLSDDERLKQRDQAAVPTAHADRTGFWSALTGILKRRRSHRFSSAEDGIYLDDIDYKSMDPQELSKFFPSSSAPVEVVGGASLGFEPTAGSSGVGSSPSLSLSPAHSINDLQRECSLNQLISTLDGVELSLCGGLAEGTVTEDSFQNFYVSFSEYCADPVAILANPNLVVRVDGKYYSWQVAGPFIMSIIVFLQVLPQKTQDNVVKKYMPKKKGQSFWNFWGRGQKDVNEDTIERAKSEGATPVGSPQKWSEDNRKKMTSKARGGREGVEMREVMLSSDEDGDVTTEILTRPRQRSLRRKKIGFTNILTSEQLERLSLKPGANRVVFSITTKYQGTAKANCTVYLWDYHDKIIVSDIDGTITRSDVAGQVLPFLGMDWTQNGVVELFSAIAKNGYKIVYLSARAIGQAGYTKEFLRKVRRGPSRLPDGPLFLFPFSLYKAFRKEVIEKRPEEFKIDCLKQIRALFPDSCTPLHAGFGNKHNDVKSYMNVDIPESRIFTVNHKGILKHELSFSFQSSYMDLKEIVDHQFPPLRGYHSSFSYDTTDYEEDTKEEYSHFSFWRTPISCEISLELPDTPSCNH